MEAEDRILKLQTLLHSFSEEERDRIVEILQVALEITPLLESE